MSELEPSVSTRDVSARASGSDRRQNTFQTVIHSSYRKRRVGPRRDSEFSVPHYVDIHKPFEFYAVVAAIVLSVLDCFFTLTLLQHGSEELNPFMDYFIQQDATLFFIVKFLLTAVGLLFLILHKTFKLFNIVSGFQLLVGCLILYTVLVAYELSMLIHFI